MDAVKYLKEASRMCNTVRDSLCPLRKDFGGNITFPCKGTELSAELKSTEKCASIVEKWSAEHPIKTRQSEFLKMFPDASLDINGCILIDPCDLDMSVSPDNCKKFATCPDCRKGYWLAEVK